MALREPTEHTKQLVQSVQALISSKNLSASKACEELNIKPGRYYSAVSLYGKKAFDLPNGVEAKPKKKSKRTSKIPAVIDIVPAPHAHVHGDKLVMVMGTAHEIQLLLKGLL